MIGHLVKTHVHMCSTRQAVVDVSDSMPVSGHARRGPDVCFLTTASFACCEFRPGFETFQVDFLELCGQSLQQYHVWSSPRI